MFLNQIFSNSILLSQKSLDHLWQEQKVILNNIANVSTPGFKAQYVTFEEEFRTRLSSIRNKKGSEIRKEILGSKAFVHTSQQESARMDGNNVNMDVESLELARNGLQYEYLLMSINNDFNRLRTAIKG